MLFASLRVQPVSLRLCFEVTLVFDYCVPEGILSSALHTHGYVKNLVLALTNKWDAHLSPFWEGGHIKFWSRRTLSQLLNESGFDVVRFIGAGSLPLLWKSMIIVAQKHNSAAGW